MGTLRNGINSPDSKLDVNTSPFLDKNEDLWQIWFGFNSDCYTFKDNLRYQLRYPGESSRISVIGKNKKAVQNQARLPGNL